MAQILKFPTNTSKFVNSNIDSSPLAMSFAKGAELPFGVLSQGDKKFLYLQSTPDNSPVFNGARRIEAEALTDIVTNLGSRILGQRDLSEHQKKTLELQLGDMASKTKADRFVPLFIKESDVAAGTLGRILFEAKDLRRSLNSSPGNEVDVVLDVGGVCFAVTKDSTISSMIQELAKEIDVWRRIYTTVPILNTGNKLADLNLLAEKVKAFNQGVETINVINIRPENRRSHAAVENAALMTMRPSSQIAPQED